MAEDLGELGQLLRHLRQSRSLSQEELAERSGVSVRTICDIERGRTARPHRETLLSIAAALGLDGAQVREVARLARPGSPGYWIPGEATTGASAVQPARGIHGSAGQRTDDGRGDASATPPASPPPHQLPAVVSPFEGRADELKTMTAMLGKSAGAEAVVISVIGGTAGVGKTALAVYWAHQVAGSFPDGQLYVNLRGYDPGEPMTATDVLGRFVRDLGVPSSDIPAGEEERAVRYRSLLAGRRMLILLDNARAADQVRPLLPAASGCTVVVTSRDALAGLVARDGARRLDLDLLLPADAVSLLHALIGDRVNAEPEAAAAIAEHCGRLPLALRIAAELAAARPSAPLAGLATELACHQQRLDLLGAGGDPHTAVRAVFSWSIRHLDTDTARAFRLQGLHPGPDFGPYAAAALTGSTLKHASHMLDQLQRAHLIQAAGPGRYAMHDLLRDYARELAASDDGEDEQRAAQNRLLDHYVHAAAAAMHTLYPAEQQNRPAIPEPATVAPSLSAPEKARTWLAAELPCLVAVAGHAAARGWPGHAIHLSATLYRYLDASGHFGEAVDLHDHARIAAEQTSDLAAEAAALTSLGTTELQQGRYPRAARHLQRARTLRHQAGDRSGEARALISLGILADRQGRFGQAADHHQLALSLYRETGNQVSEVIALINLGNAEMVLGRLEQAAHHLEQALALSRSTGYHYGEAFALLNLGEVSLQQGRYEQAARYLHRVLALCRDTSDRVGEAYALNGFGELDLREGRYSRATGHLQHALALARDTGERTAQTVALNLLGEVSLATGDHRQASNHHASALVLASHTGHKTGQARAHHGLARTHHADQDQKQARYHWQQALNLYTEMGSPNADQIRAELRAAGSRPQLDQRGRSMPVADAG